MYIIGYCSFDKLQVAFVNNSREMFIVYQVSLLSCSFEHLSTNNNNKMKVYAESKLR